MNQSQSEEKSTNNNENIITMPTEEIQSNQLSLPTDNSSLKVSIIEQRNMYKIINLKTLNQNSFEIALELLSLKSIQNFSLYKSEKNCPMI